MDGLDIIGPLQYSNGMFFLIGLVSFCIVAFAFFALGIAEAALDMEDLKAEIKELKERCQQYEDYIEHPHMPMVAGLDDMLAARKFRSKVTESETN